VGGTSVGAPSWAGLIAVADQGLAASGAGPLTNAQSSLYQLSGSAFNAVTSGSNGYYSAGAGYNLVAGLGSPKANLLIPALINLNSATAKSAPAAIRHAPTASGAGGVQVVITSGSTSSVSGTGAGTTSSSSSSSITSITALNTNFNSTSGANTVVVIYVVPPPPVIHLTQSSAPMTNQSDSVLLSTQDEQPTSITRFGQGPEDDAPIPFFSPAKYQSRPASFLDYVEPFQPLAPGGAPAGDPGLPPGQFMIRPMSGPTDATDFAVDSFFLGSWHDRSIGAEKPQGERSGSSGASTLFGAAVVVLGGYHLAMREADRTRGRLFHRSFARSTSTARSHVGSAC
jgi:hypothetical protein